MSTNLKEGEESNAQILEPTKNPEEEETPKKESDSGKEDKSDNDLTPPKKNNYMYMEESEEDNYGYANKEDYYNELEEGEIDLDDEDALSADDEDLRDTGVSPIEQLKNVLLKMKGKESNSSPEKSKDNAEEGKKSSVHTPQAKSKKNKGKTYKEDEEKAPFTPL